MESVSTAFVPSEAETLHVDCTGQVFCRQNRAYDETGEQDHYVTAA